MLHAPAPGAESDSMVPGVSPAIYSAEDFRRNLEPLPKEGKRRFWTKLADLRKRAKERRRIARLLPAGKLIST